MSFEFDVGVPGLRFIAEDGVPLLFNTALGVPELDFNDPELLGVPALVM